MMRITMFEVKPDVTETQLVLPKDSEMLSTICKYNKIFVYAIIDSEMKETEVYSIKCYKTGLDIDFDKAYKFLGTVCLVGGEFTYHIFSKKLS